MHNHPDRDNFINVLYENMSPGAEGLYNKINPRAFSNFNTPYDYKSLMHYEEMTASKNGKPTIVPKDRRFINQVGGGNDMSPGDITRIKNMYQCP
jgi:meprin A